MRFLPLILILFLGCIQITQEPACRDVFPDIIRYGTNIAATDGNSICIADPQNSSLAYKLSEEQNGKIIDMMWVGDELVSLQIEGSFCKENNFCVKTWNINNGTASKTIDVGPETTQYFYIVNLENNTSEKRPYSFEDARKNFSGGHILRQITPDRKIVYIIPDQRKDGVLDLSPPIAWNSDGNNVASYNTSKKKLDFYHYNGTLALNYSINADIEQIFDRRLGYSIRELSFSPDGRLIAITGSYSITAGPSIAHKSELGFITVFDIASGNILLSDSGGEIIGSNEAIFDWSNDGKIVYLFSGEKPDLLRIRKL